MSDIGKALIVIGAITLLLGVLVSIAGRMPWLGRLPGDMVIDRGNFHFYFPIVTCIVISLVLNLFLWLLRR